MNYAQTNFVKYSTGSPVLEKESDITTKWDVTAVADAEVVFYLDTFRIWYTSAGAFPYFEVYPRIGYAWSLDGISWTRHPDPVLEGTSGEWDSLSVETVSVLVDETAPSAERFKMWYIGTQDPTQIMYHSMGYAYSGDGINWTKHTSNPIITAESSFTGIDVGGFEGPSVVYDGTTYHMWYTCIPWYGGSEYWDGWVNIAYASSVDGISWTKKMDEPVLKVSENSWDSLFVQTPDVIKVGDTYHMFYSGTTSDSTYQTAGGGWHYRVGYAWAHEDDIHNWTRHPSPVLTNGTPGSWDDASVGLVSVEYVDDNLHMWYTGQDSCLNDTTCVWPEPYYWDTGYAVDSSAMLGNEVFISENKPIVRIHPNPCENELFIELENDQVPGKKSCRIFDPIGRQVGVHELSDSGKTRLDMVSFQSGIYSIVVYHNDTRLLTRKVICR